MTKMLTARIGFLLIAMHFVLMVLPQPTTSFPPVTTRAVGVTSNATTMPQLVATTTTPNPKGEGAPSQSSGFTLLIPMAVVGLLQGHF
ncbi:hypothetical protein DPEC_G00314380 [Dallia pectoralis]|uniref:Uncharacterized protein n=1 Tax=Dallia pectoralis TaxID=75939 RepID=A0ACC2FCB2_DALPE|nr:hypothetical protein DPEC_G00314380 [Dallia pectoralis]